MRIIAGRAKGLGLKTPPGDKTRPMDGRARGALFNILTARLDDVRVLDLYAGSGALGLEALSRGASGCVFVEKTQAAARVLAENLDRSRLEGGEIMTAPCVVALKHLAAREERFGLVFMDPPFAESRTEAGRAGLVRQMDEAAGLLEPRGELVWRLERRNYNPEDLPARLEPVDRREYGRSLLVFMERRAESEPAQESA